MDSGKFFITHDNTIPVFTAPLSHSTEVKKVTHTYKTELYTARKDYAHLDTELCTVKRFCTLTYRAMHSQKGLRTLTYTTLPSQEGLRTLIYKAVLSPKGLCTLTFRGISAEHTQKGLSTT